MMRTHARTCRRRVACVCMWDVMEAAEATGGAHSLNLVCESLLICVFRVRFCPRRLRPSADTATPPLALVVRTLQSTSHESEKRLMSKCRELNNDLVAAAAKVESVAQDAFYNDQQMEQNTKELEQV